MRLRVDREEYKRQKWLVHELAHDFELQDSWRIPVKTSRPFEEFLKFFLSVDPVDSVAPVRGLFGLRMKLGKLLKLDEEEGPIPGTGEASISERLVRPEASFTLPKANSFAKFKPVYLRENEALLEISNKTIFALIHLGRKDDEIWLGIFTKSYGVLSDVYMGLIKPFRQFIVYPLWLNFLEREWKKREQHLGTRF